MGGFFSSDPFKIDILNYSQFAFPVEHSDLCDQS